MVVAASSVRAVQQGKPGVPGRRLGPVILLVAWLLAVPKIARAGPWVPEPHTAYLKTWVRWLPGRGFSDGSGELLDYAGYHEVGWLLYTEVGLWQDVALTVHHPLVQAFFLRNPGTARYSAHVTSGDPSLGVRWQALSRGGFVLSLETSLRFPIAPPWPVQTVYGPDPDSAAIGELQIGSGVWDITGGALVGYSFPDFYLAAALAYIARTGGFDHDLYWLAEGGFPFLNRFYARARLTGRHPLPVGDDDVPRHNSPSGIGNGTSYIGLAGEVELRIDPRWSLGVSLEGGLFAVQRQSRGPVTSLFVATLF